jgi:hypothetical protein
MEPPGPSETPASAPEAAPAPLESPTAERRPGYLRWLPHKPALLPHYLSRWLFLRGLGIVYLLAFASLWVQVDGLIGRNGIAPAEAFAEEVRGQIGSRAYFLAPSLFWLYPHDATLHVLCAGGVVAALLLIAGVAPTLCLAVLWSFYLSLAGVGSDFLAFQWDSLLLEVGFIAVFFAPLQWLPRPSSETKPSPVVLFLLWWVLFRLMLGSGVVKVGDPSWDSLTALAYHYETQPLPTPLAWHLIQLPLWFHKATTALVLSIELVVPFLILFGRRPRAIAGVVFIVFQLCIIATGNFAFFNWLAIVLCLPLFDDEHLRHVVPAGLAARFSRPSAPPRLQALRRAGAAVLLVTVVFLGLLQMVRGVYRDAEPPRPLQAAVRAMQPFRLVNTYGLFAVMTTTRPEIVIEGSRDGETWKEYRFRYKPVDVRERPKWVAPHQPRLDWQMWFAALGPPRAAPWFFYLVVRLLEGQQETLDLLAENPFPDGPPKFVRATLYEYRFSRRGEDDPPDAWWVRRELGPYAPPMSLGTAEE